MKNHFPWEMFFLKSNGPNVNVCIQSVTSSRCYAASFIIGYDIDWLIQLLSQIISESEVPIPFSLLCYSLKNSENYQNVNP